MLFRTSTFLFAVSLASLGGCAENECSFNSQCGPSMYCFRGGCRQSCELDLDCEAGEVCSPIGQCEPAPDVSRSDAGAEDQAIDAPRDEGALLDLAMADRGVADSSEPDMARPDVGLPDLGSPDTGVRDTGVDLGAPETGVLGERLDPCTLGLECASGFCADGRCSIGCARDDQCADDEYCRSGICAIDDTGVSCSPDSPGTCGLGLCLGRASAQCTRPCNTARDCPSGFACSVTGGATSGICVEIEVPCSGPDQCATGLCLTVQGCTAECRGAADCPIRAGDLGARPYECRRAFGSTNPICVPPDDILGSDRLGAPCPATGANACRSGLCNPESPGGPMCVQTCTPEGGCPPGFGCKPEELDTGISFLCARAGSRTLGESCTRASECESALCSAPGYCTRLCNDGLCPSGFRCDTVPGTAVPLCVRS